MIVVKIFYPDKSHAEIISVQSFPFTLGRGLDNSKILDHSSVSAHHLVIDRKKSTQAPDEEFWVQNLSKTHGMVCDGKKIETLKIDRMQSVQAGAVSIEFWPIDSEIEITQDIPLEHTEWRNLALGITAIAACAAFDFYLTLGVESKGSRLATNLLSVVGVSLILAAITSLFSKITQGKFRILVLWTQFSWILAVWMLADFLLTTVIFNIPWSLVATAFTLIAEWGLIFWSALRVSRLLFRRVSDFDLRVRVAVGSILLMLGLKGLAYLSQLDSIYFEFDGSVAYPFLNGSAENDGIDALNKSLDESAKSIEKYRKDSDLFQGASLTQRQSKE